MDNVLIAATDWSLDNGWGASHMVITVLVIIVLVLIVLYFARRV